MKYSKIEIIMTPLKEFLHFWGWYNEKTPKPQIKNNYYICPFCDAKLVTETEYEIHMGRNHIKNGYDLV